MFAVRLISFRCLERIMLKTRQTRSDPLPDSMTSGSGDSRSVDEQELAQLFALRLTHPLPATRWLSYQRFFGAAVNSRQ